MFETFDLVFGDADGEGGEEAAEGVVGVGAEEEGSRWVVGGEEDVEESVEVYWGGGEVEEGRFGEGGEEVVVEFWHSWDDSRGLAEGGAEEAEGVGGLSVFNCVVDVGDYEPAGWGEEADFTGCLVDAVEAVGG